MIHPNAAEDMMRQMELESELNTRRGARILPVGQEAQFIQGIEIKAASQSEALGTLKGEQRLLSGGAGKSIDDVLIKAAIREDRLRAPQGLLLHRERGIGVRRAGEEHREVGAGRIQRSGRRDGGRLLLARGRGLGIRRFLSRSGRGCGYNIGGTLISAFLAPEKIPVTFLHCFLPANIHGPFRVVLFR